MKRSGRPYPTHTPLGRLMHELGLRVSDVERASGVSHRTISDYLAGRREYLPDHRARIADALGVRPGALGPVRSLEPRISHPTPRPLTVVKP